MQTLLHADIFFFITSIVVVLIGIGAIISIIFSILILRNLLRLSETVKTEAGYIVKDIDDIRAKAKGFSWAIAFQLFQKFIIKRFINKKIK